MKPWRVSEPLPPTLAEMASRGPLVLCLHCGTYRTTVPALVASNKASGMAREVLEAHDDARGRLCEGSGEAWESVRGELEDMVPATRSVR